MLKTADLFTGKLVKLTAPREGDSAIMAAWTQNSDYLRLMDTDIARPLSEEAVADSEKGEGRNSAYFRIRTVEDDRLIGFVVLHSFEWNNGTSWLSIGIGEPDYWGRGYGFEAIQLILRYGFMELNLHRVSLNFISYNERAEKAYAKAGFAHEGAEREACYRDGRYYDLVYMGILRTEWLQRHPLSD